MPRIFKLAKKHNTWIKLYVEHDWIDGDEPLIAMITMSRMMMMLKV